MNIMERIEAERWECHWHRMGGSGFSVNPGRGLIGCENWALIRDREAAWPLRAASYLWRVITGTYYRRQYPKTEKGLRRAIAECERWCEVENRLEDEKRAVAVKVRAG